MKQLAGDTDISLYCAVKHLILTEFWSTFTYTPVSSTVSAHSASKWHTMLIYHQPDQKRAPYWFLPDLQQSFCDTILQSAWSLQCDLDSMGYRMTMSQSQDSKSHASHSIASMGLEFDSNWTCLRNAHS